MLVRALRDKNRSRANCVPIYGDLYQNLQWSLSFTLKVVTHLKSASEASYDHNKKLPVNKSYSLCWYGHIYPTRTLFLNIISIILVIWWLHQCFTWLWQWIISQKLYFACKIPYISYKYPAYWTTFRLMADNIIAPPGEFASLYHLKEDYKLRIVIDVCTMFAGALVSDSLLHMLPY